MIDPVKAVSAAHRAVVYPGRALAGHVAALLSTDNFH